MPVSLTPTLLPKRNKTQQLFWTNTWPQLKEEGWNYDGKRFFYPPKRRQAGCAEAKEFFSGIGEITEYIRKNPVRFIDDHAKGGDASAEEHKSSGEDTKKKSSMKKKQKVVESDKDSDVTVSSEENDGEDGDTAFTPYSSPKPEPSAPTPKTSSFRLESALSSSSSANASSPFTKKQAKKESKKSIIKLRVVPLKERQSKKKKHVHGQRCETVHLRSLRQDRFHQRPRPWRAQEILQQTRVQGGARAFGNEVKWDAPKAKAERFCWKLFRLSPYCMWRPRNEF